MNYRKNLFVSLFLIVIVFVPLSSNIAAVSADTSSSCSTITHTMRYRVSDGGAGGDVTKLQSFLQSKNFLTTTPSGYFGAMTLQAVQKFQKANGIDSTGYVGPLTLQKIKTQCGGSVISNQNSNTNTQNIPPATNQTTLCSLKINSLYLYQSIEPTTFTSVSWDNVSCNPAMEVMVKISRLDTNGVWDISASPVTASSGVAVVSLPNTFLSGAYRVYLVKSGTNSQVSNAIQVNVNMPYVTVSVLGLNAISPSSVSADDKTVLTLSGSSFSASTTVYINGFKGTKIKPSSIDTTNNTLTFTVPKTVGPGLLGVGVSNDGLNLSNVLPVTITAPFSKYSITNTVIPSTYVGANFRTQVYAAGFSDDYSWSITKGALPAGVSIANVVGAGYMAPLILSGIPQTSGTYIFTVEAKDVYGNSASQEMTLIVAPDPNGGAGRPAIFAISPTSGEVGTTVSIIGGRFDSKNYILLGGRIVGSSTASSDGKTLSFSIPVVTSNNCGLFGTSCQHDYLVTIPGTYSVSVQNAQGVSNGFDFTVLPKPTTN